MTTGQTLAFVLFAVVTAITPGPSNLILASTGAAVGVLRGLPTLLGQVVGMALMLFLVAFGLGSLVLKNRLLVEGLRWCGAGFLLWLSWKVATSHHSDETEERVHVGFWKAAAFQWVNPKAWLVCVGVVATYFPVGAGSAVARTLVLALLFILAALPSCFLWLAAGASVQRYLHSRRAWRIFNGTMGGCSLAPFCCSFCKWSGEISRHDFTVEVESGGLYEIYQEGSR